MSRRLAFALLALPAMSGCSLTHARKNAPGHVDLSTKPKDPTPGVVDEPGDPGERAFLLSPGPYVGGGSAKVGDHREATWVTGLEVSGQWGSRDKSHPYDDFFLTAPRQRVGANLGVDLLTRERRKPDRVYGEVQYLEDLGFIAGGWAVSPALGKSGPHVTLGWGPFYLRSSTMLGHGTDFTGGIVIKFPAVWWWSR